MNDITNLVGRPFVQAGLPEDSIVLMPRGRGWDRTSLGPGIGILHFGAIGPRTLVREWW